MMLHKSHTNDFLPYEKQEKKKGGFRLLFKILSEYTLQY